MKQSRTSHLAAATGLADLCPLLSDEPAAAQSINPADVDWHQVMEIAETTGVGAALAHSLTATDSGIPYPQWLEQRLSSNLRASVIRNLAIKSDAIRIGRLLNEAGIVPVFFKGTAGLLTELHPTAGFRHQLDIDLMVEQQQEERALAALRAAGYQYCESIDSEHGSYLRGTSEATAAERLLRQFRQHHHYPPLLRPGQGHSIELHRHPLPRRWHRRLPLQEIFCRLQEKQVQGTQFKVPTPELGIVIAVLGKFASDGNHSCYRLPLAQALDCRALAREAGPSLDLTWIESTCGSHARVFRQLSDLLLSGQQPDDATLDLATRIFLFFMALKRQRPKLTPLIENLGYRRQQMINLCQDPGKLLRPRV